MAEERNARMRFMAKRCATAAICCLILAGTMMRATAVEPSSECSVQDQAASSAFFGQLNRTQAAELLERIIREGQNHAILLKYLGVDPRIIAEVHADQIAVRFRSFDQFSQHPVQWSRMGSQMTDFTAKWPEVTEVSATEINDDDGVPCWYLRLESVPNQTSTILPLQPKPAGYTREDALLAVSILTGRIKASDTLDRTTPPPTDLTPPPSNTLSEASAETTPTKVTPEPTPTQTSETAPTPAIHETPVAPRPVQHPPTPQTPTDDALRQKLQTLKQLFDEGLIDDDVYREKQRELLDQLLK